MKRKRRELQGIQSIEVGTTLLRVLASAEGPLTLTKLAALAKMPTSKARRYLVSMLRTGLVMQDAMTNRYDLGCLSLKLGIAALHRIDPIQYSTEAAFWLNQELDISVALIVWGNMGPTVIALYDSSQLLIQNLRVGSVLAVTRSSAGRLFLAYMPRATTLDLVKRELKGGLWQNSLSRVRSIKDVDGIVQEVRKRRLGTTKGDLVQGHAALSAPVFDHQGRIVASLTVIGSVDSVSIDAPNSPAKTLLRVADSVSERLGFWDHEIGASFAERLEIAPERIPRILRSHEVGLSDLFVEAMRTERHVGSD